jgi:hypothetical protein
MRGILGADVKVSGESAYTFSNGGRKIFADLLGSVDEIFIFFSF